MFKTRNAGCVLRFKRKRKIVNAKIYEDKRDLYCTSSHLVILLHMGQRSRGYIHNLSTPSQKYVTTDATLHHLFRKLLLLMKINCMVEKIMLMEKIPQFSLLLPYYCTPDKMARYIFITCQLRHKYLSPPSPYDKYNPKSYIMNERK